MSTILTLTINPSIDKNSTIDHVVPDRKLRCREPHHDPGGGGINVSRAIKKLGGTSVALYPCGGPTGQLLESLLDREQIEQYPVPIKGLTRVNFTVFEEATSQQFRFDIPGPTLSETEWKRCLRELHAIDPVPEYLVASGSLPPGVPTDFYARAARVATALGARTILDTSGEALRAGARAGVYLLKCNLRELAELVGERLADESQQEAAAMELVERGACAVVVVSLGAAGLLYVSRKRCERLRTPTVPVISKIGAGDSMVAGVVLNLARGHALDDAILFGNAAGTAAVMTPGTDLCRREDAERLYERMVSETGTVASV